ncbi:unnamed protein product, partial [Adineta steineri]
ADQLLQHLEEYLGSNLQVFSTVKPLVQQLTEAVILVVPILPSNIGKYEVPAAHTSLNDLLVLLDQLQLHTWNAVIAVFPKYSDLVNQLVDAIDQITNAFSSPQLNSLAQQIIYLALDVYDEKVGIYVAADQLFLQVKQYLGSNAKIFSTIQFFAQQLIDAIILVVPILPPNNGKHETSAAHVDGFAVVSYPLQFEIHTYNPNAPKHEQKRLAHKWEKELPDIPHEMELLLNVRLKYTADRYRLQLIILDYNGKALICHQPIMLTPYGIVDTMLSKAQNTFKMQNDDGRVQNNR